MHQAGGMAPLSSTVSRSRSADTVSEGSRSPVSLAPVALEADPTAELLAWAAAIESSDATTLEKARQFATRLGAHWQPDGLTTIGFWTPELAGDVIQPRNILLEVFTPLEIDRSQAP